MKKIKEIAGVPKKYVLISSIFAMVWAWFIPVLQDVSLGKLLLILLGTLIATIIAHEALHGIWFKIFTGKVVFGVLLKKFVFYASSPDSKIKRNQFILICLFPQILAIPLFLIMRLNNSPLVSYMASVSMLFNLCGGVSDWWASFTLARYPENVFIEDTKAGAVIWQKI